MKGFQQTNRLPIKDHNQLEKLFEKNYFDELKKSQLAKIHSCIGDIYLAMERFQEAEQYYKRPIEYLETFSSLFHLELADLYSKLAYIAEKLKESSTIVTSLFEKTVEVMQYNRNKSNQMSELS